MVRTVPIDNDRGNGGLCVHDGFCRFSTTTSMDLLRVRRQSIACHSATGVRIIGVLRYDHLLQNSTDAARNPPVGIIALEFSQIRDVANVIALPRLLDVMPVQLAPGEPFDAGDGFQHRDAVAAPAT